MKSINLHVNTPAANVIGESNVNWPREINKLIRLIDKPTKKSLDIVPALFHELNIMHNRSSTWQLCAVGNLCDIIPRFPDNSPKDDLLALLGYDFNDAILDAYRETLIDPDCFLEWVPSKDCDLKTVRRFLVKALEIHYQIEQRAAELIQENMSEKTKVTGFHSTKTLHKP